MAEILVKGMKMPKNCNKCPFEKYKKEKRGYIWFCSLTNTECENVLIYNKDCPLVELPPHGRLADIDANIDDFMQTVYSELYSDGDNYRANRIIDAYDEAPIIIEAST